MKWLVVAGCLLCLISSLHANVLRCTPDSEDEPCSPDIRILKKSDLLSGKECLPGTQWKSRCNQCSCTDEGMPLCTEMACDSSEKDPILRCAPDTIWKNDCNTCWCTSTGYAMCTRIGCNAHVVTNFNPTGEAEPNEQNLIPDDNIEINYIDDEDFDDHEITKRSVCEPNARFKIECNSCKCDPNGQSYVCTQNECLERDMDKEVEVFMEHEALKSSINNTKAVVCAANRMFVKDCNTCWCNEDGTSYFCTRKVCVPELPEDVTTEETEDLNVIKRQCRPDEVFELDCNMCRCNPDGKSFSCTRRACIPEDDVKDGSLKRKTRATSQASSRSDTTGSRFIQHVKEPPKACQPGQEFRMDCNKCLCDNEGQTFSCTRIDCAALNNNNNGGTRRKREVTAQSSKECIPGSKIEQGCKECRCAEDGRHVVCPTKCQQEKEPSENDINNTGSDPSFRCNPGEQFKRSCNDCTCSADGKSFFCTLRLCEEEITPSI